MLCAHVLQCGRAQPINDYGCVCRPSVWLLFFLTVVLVRSGLVHLSIIGSILLNLDSDTVQVSLMTDAIWYCGGYQRSSLEWHAGWCHFGEDLLMDCDNILWSIYGSRIYLLFYIFTSIELLHS